MHIKVSSQLLLITPSTHQYERCKSTIDSAVANEYDMKILNTLSGDMAMVLPHNAYDLYSRHFRMGPDHRITWEMTRKRCRTPMRRPELPSFCAFRTGRCRNRGQSRARACGKTTCQNTSKRTDGTALIFLMYVLITLVIGLTTT